VQYGFGSWPRNNTIITVIIIWISVLQPEARVVFLNEILIKHLMFI
jgi:hypothetical protein